MALSNHSQDFSRMEMLTDDEGLGGKVGVPLNTCLFFRFSSYQKFSSDYIIHVEFVCSFHAYINLFLLRFFFFCRSLASVFAFSLQTCRALCRLLRCTKYASRFYSEKSFFASSCENMFSRKNVWWIFIPLHCASHTHSRPNTWNN